MLRKLCVHIDSTLHIDSTETVHCSTKDAYTSEITFIALLPWARQTRDPG